MEFGNDVNVWKEPFLRRKQVWQGTSATNSGRLCWEAPRTRAEIPADGVVGRQDEAWPSRPRRGCRVRRRMAVLTAHHIHQTGLAASFGCAGNEWPFWPRFSF